MIQGSPETIRKLRKPGFQGISRSGGYPSTTQLLPIRPRPSKPPLRVLLGGGPGSGCNPEVGKCGRPGSGGEEDVKQVTQPKLAEALSEWTSVDQNPGPLGDILQQILDGDTDSPETKAFLSMAKQAREALGGGLSNIKLWRVNLGTSQFSPSSGGQSKFKSYAENEGGARSYLRGYEDSSGNKLPDAVIKSAWVSIDRVVAYHKQSDNFLQNEQEVIISKIPFAIPSHIQAGGPGSGRHPEFGNIKDTLEKAGYKHHSYAGVELPHAFIHKQTGHWIDVHPETGKWVTKSDPHERYSGTGHGALKDYLSGKPHKIASPSLSTKTLQRLGMKEPVYAGGPGSGCNPEVGKCGRPPGPGHTEAPTVKIPRADYPLSKEQLKVQEKFAKQVESDPEKAIRDYTAKYGNILNADNAKELSPDYMKDKSTMAPAVHETASWLVKQIYKRELAQDAPPGKANMVFFTAGGAGAGKTTAVESTHHGKEVSDRAQIIYDGTLRPASSAISKIDQALNAGKSAVVAFTHRDPVEAFRNGVLGRAARQEAKDGSGRTVMLDEFIRQHTSVRDSMMEVYNRYRDHPDFHMMIFDNSRGAGNAKLVPSMNDLPPARKDVDNLRKELKGVLDDVYRQGKISRKIYEATLGEGFSHHKEIGI